MSDHRRHRTAQCSGHNNVVSMGDRRSPQIKRCTSTESKVVAVESMQKIVFVSGRLVMYLVSFSGTGNTTGRSLRQGNVQVAEPFLHSTLHAVSAN